MGKIEKISILVDEILEVEIFFARYVEEVEYIVKKRGFFFLLKLYRKIEMSIDEVEMFWTIYYYYYY